VSADLRRVGQIGYQISRAAEAQELAKTQVRQALVGVSAAKLRLDMALLESTLFAALGEWALVQLGHLLAKALLSSSASSLHDPDAAGWTEVDKHGRPRAKRHDDLVSRWLHVRERGKQQEPQSAAAADDDSDSVQTDNRGRAPHSGHRGGRATCACARARARPARARRGRARAAGGACRRLKRGFAARRLGFGRRGGPQRVAARRKQPLMSAESCAK
jgi:hypothetical protein